MGGRGGVVTSDDICIWHHYYYYYYYIICCHKPALPGIVRTYNHMTSVELKIWWLNDSYFFRCRDPDPACPPSATQRVSSPPTTYLPPMWPPWELSPRRFPFAQISRLYNIIPRYMLWSYSSPYVLYRAHTYVIDLLYYNNIISMYPTIPTSYNILLLLYATQYYYYYIVLRSRIRHVTFYRGHNKHRTLLTIIFVAVRDSFEISLDDNPYYNVW